MSDHARAIPPWKTWFEGLATDEGLRHRITLRTGALQGLVHDSPVVACERLREAWKRTYIPSTGHLAVIRQLVDRVRVCAEVRIPSAGDYEAAIYSRRPILLSEQEVWGLTGLAGCGKSSAMKALLRALQPDEPRWITPGVQASIEPVLHIAMRAQRSASPVLRALANPVFVAGRKNIPPAELSQHLRQWLYVQGTQLLLVDELQALTRGENSTTLIANLIGELNELGLAVVYIFNHSLGHKLMQRPQEDKDRLLSKCLSLMPPRVSDPNWPLVVDAYVAVADGLIAIDAERDAAELHLLTAGLYRLLGFLLLGACRIAWPSKVGRAVTMADVRAAYQAGTYASQRDDVEALRSLHFNARLSAVRRDLRSPFADQAQAAVAGGASLQAPLLQPPPPAAAVHLMESALNVEERQVLKQLRSKADVQPMKPASATITKFPSRKRMSADALLAGAKLLATETGRTKKRDMSGSEPAEQEDNR